jgi:hypothetical protein
MRASFSATALLAACVGAVSCFHAPAQRTAVFWLVPYQNLTTTEQYTQIWQQFSQYSSGNRSVYVAGSAYALKHDGSLGYANTTAGEGLDGEGMEQLGFPALRALNLSVLGMTYFTHYDGMKIVLDDPQPFVTALVAKVKQQGLSGIDLDYEPQNVARASQEVRAMRLQQQGIGEGDADDAAADPFLQFLALLGSSAAAEGLFVSMDIGGSCIDAGTSECKGYGSVPGLNQVNSEDTFGVSSVADFQTALQNNAQAGLEGRWAPGFEPGNCGADVYAAVLQYAATKTRVNRIATWAVHEYNVGPQPDWLFDTVNAFLDA